MALIALASAGGSPGVTTTALALAHHGGALVVDADLHPSGHLWSGYFGGHRAPVGGLTHAAEAQRRHLPLILDELTVDVGVGRYVPGWLTPAAPRLSPTLWRELGPLLRTCSTSTLTVIDVGRVGPHGVPEEIAGIVEKVVWVTSSNLTSVARDRLHLPQVREQIDSVELLVVGPGRPYAADDVADALGCRLAGVMPWHPDQARVLSEGAAAPRKTQMAGAARMLASAWSGAQVAA